MNSAATRADDPVRALDANGIGGGGGGGKPAGGGPEDFAVVAVGASGCGRFAGPPYRGAFLTFACRGGAFASRAAMSFDGS